jgi:hypothetical protein
MSIGEDNRQELVKLLPPWNPDELQELCSAASFTVQDMAVWCGVEKSTMRTWAVDKMVPHRVKQQYLRPRLDLLRRALKELPELPVPMIKRHERITYIREVLDHALNLPKESPAKRGS